MNPWWWAWGRPKHVELLINVNNKLEKLLHLVGLIYFNLAYEVADSQSKNSAVAAEHTHPCMSEQFTYCSNTRLSFPQFHTQAFHIPVNLQECHPIFITNSTNDRSAKRLNLNGDLNIFLRFSNTRLWYSKNWFSRTYLSFFGLYVCPLKTSYILFCSRQKHYTLTLYSYTRQFQIPCFRSVLRTRRLWTSNGS